MRRTHALVQVAKAMMDVPTGRHWGYELSKSAGVRSGVMYPILTRMLDEGMVKDGWEDDAIAATEKRPPRRYYVLTGHGQAVLSELLRDAKTDPRFTWVLDGLRRGAAWN
ncbi:MAG: PadR family transcriptional regulator [Actinomycetia bacterium]|nr:PadR family transcriptional regulator [Actinomycetes bacterium]